MTGPKKKFLSPDELEEAANQIATIAKISGIRAVLIGGYAMQLYGSDRLTGDVDFATERLLPGLPHVKPLTFGGEQTEAPNGAPVDIVVRDDDYTSLYEAAIVDPLPHDPNDLLLIVRPEYLAAMKLAAGRKRDFDDLDTLITSDESSLDKEIARRIIKKHMGAYAAKEFDRITDVADAKAHEGISARRARRAHKSHPIFQHGEMIMGYTTTFSGHFNLDRKLEPEHSAYLRKFSETRRMKRNAAAAEQFEDPIRKSAKLPIGKDGGFFVNGGGWAGQERDESILDFNNSPSDQPGLWCQWVPTDDFSSLEWNGAEKFYCYTEWLEYLIDNFLKPWGYTLNGEVTWRGEEHSDIGLLLVTNNVVTTHEGYVEMVKAAKNPENKPELVVLTATFTKKMLDSYKKSGDERDAMVIANIVIEEYKTERKT